MAKRDFRPEEIEDWALLYDVYEKIDTALASGTAGVKRAARRGNRLLNLKRNRYIEFETVRAVIIDMVQAGIITSEERQALLRRADVDATRTKAMFVADQIVMRLEEVAMYDDNAKRFEKIIISNQPENALPEHLHKYLHADRNAMYSDETLSDTDVAEICKHQLCRRSRMSVRAERGEMMIAKSALDQLQAELTSLVGSIDAPTYIAEAQTRYEVAKMGG